MVGRHADKIFPAVLGIEWGQERNHVRVGEPVFPRCRKILAILVPGHESKRKAICKLGHQPLAPLRREWEASHR